MKRAFALSMAFSTLLSPLLGKPPAKPEAIALPPLTAKTFTLENGLQIIVQEDHSAPVASVQAWCRTGSIDEGARLGSGMSHILEHMLFKGTTTRGPAEIAQVIQDHGGYINAYTSYDRTVYWIDIPATGVPTALDILSDVMVNATLPEGEYIKEQEVIRREFAMGFDDPDRMAFYAMMSEAFRVHPYQHPVIGHMPIYNTLTREDVLAYYKARYAPNNIFFVVVGAVDAETVRDRIASHLKDVPRRPVEPVFVPAEPAQLGKRESHREFPTELTRLQLCWKTPDITHPDVPALDLLGVILGGGRSSRLYQELREKNPLAHSISAFCYTPRDPGLFAVEAVCDPDHREKLTAAILDIIAKIQKEGVTGEEVVRAKKQFIAAQLRQLTTTRGIASDLGSNFILTGNLDFSREYLSALDRTTPDDIRHVANAYLHDSALTLVSLNPPASTDATPTEKPGSEAGPVHKFTLKNGLRILVREDPRLPLVSAVAAFKAGLLAESPETNGISTLAAACLLKGTETRTAEKIANEIESVGGQINADSGNQSISLKVSAMRDDLALALTLIADVLANATYPEDAVTREKQAQIAAIKAEDEEPTSVARNLMRHSLFPGHPLGLRSTGTPETIGRIGRDELLAFHKKHLVAKNGVISIFGAIKAAEALKLAEQHFATLPPGEEAFTDLPDSPRPESAKTVEASLPKSQAILMFAFRGESLASPDREVVDLLDEASSDMSSRFFLKIREEMGLAYFVGSSQNPSLVPGPFVFYLGTDPKKLDEVRAAFWSEVSKLAAEGLTEAELARAKEKLVGQMQIRNQNNDTLAHVTALDELYGLGYDDYLKRPDRIRDVTLEDTRRVAKRLFADQPAITVQVRPQPATKSE